MQSGLGRGAAAAAAAGAGGGRGGRLFGARIGRSGGEGMGASVSALGGVRELASGPGTPAAKAQKGAAGGNANKAKKSKGGAEKSASEHLTKFIFAAEEARAFKPQFSEEQLAEHAKIALTYQRKMTELNNKLNKDLTNKIWLQQEALRALPENLRLKAEIIDEATPPPDRPWPMWATPPIKDFDARQYTGKNKDGEEEEDDEEVGAGAGVGGAGAGAAPGGGSAAAAPTAASPPRAPAAAAAPAPQK